jgi:hypothetical protein
MWLVLLQFFATIFCYNVFDEVYVFFISWVIRYLLQSMLVLLYSCFYENKSEILLKIDLLQRKYFSLH